MTFRWWMVVVVVAGLCGPASAEYYKYRDKNGLLRFTDNLQEVPADQRDRIQRYREVPAVPGIKKPGVDSGRKDRQSSKTDVRQDRIAITADPDLSRASGIKAAKWQLDDEFAQLLRRKQILEAEAQRLQSPAEIRTYNKKAAELNERIAQFNRRREQFEEKAGQMKLPSAR